MKDVTLLTEKDHRAQEDPYPLFRKEYIYIYIYGRIKDVRWGKQDKVGIHSVGKFRDSLDHAKTNNEV